MHDKTETYQNMVVPESTVLKLERKNRYGSVPGLDDEELADPDELERQVYREEFEPVLILPRKGSRQGFRPAVDESGGVDWGAFGTVDFDRLKPEFDTVRYKAQKLREKLKDVLIMFSIVKERLPGRAKYLVLKYLRMGIIGLEHVTDQDMRALAELDQRARRLRSEIVELEDAGKKRKAQKLQAWLEA